MKKWLSILVVGIFIASGFGTVATTVTRTEPLSIQTITKPISVDVFDTCTDSIDVMSWFVWEIELYLLNLVNLWFTDNKTL
jgi:hypothetical protein